MLQLCFQDKTIYLFNKMYYEYLLVIMHKVSFRKKKIYEVHKILYIYFKGQHSLRTASWIFFLRLCFKKKSTLTLL